MNPATAMYKDIPAASLGVLCMIQAGIPVREIISPATYSKHRAVLKAHGFDIHKEVLERELAIEMERAQSA